MKQHQLLLCTTHAFFSERTCIHTFLHSYKNLTPQPLMSESLNKHTENDDPSGNER